MLESSSVVGISSDDGEEAGVTEPGKIEPAVFGDWFGAELVGLGAASGAPAAPNDQKKKTKTVNIRHYIYKWIIIENYLYPPVINHFLYFLEIELLIFFAFPFNLLTTFHAYILFLNFQRCLYR